MNVNAAVGKLITVMISVLFIVHMVSCIWFAVALAQNFSEDTWVQRLELTDKTIPIQYFSSWYWAFQTLTTVGYGDVKAIRDDEKVVAVVWIVFGVGFYSYTIGNFQKIL